MEDFYFLLCVRLDHTQLLARLEKPLSNGHFMERRHLKGRPGVARPQGPACLAPVQGWGFPCGHL